MSSPSDYADALQRFAAAEKTLAAMIRSIRRIADSVENYPGETCFAIINDEPSPTLDELMSGARFYSSDFPSPEALQAALRERFEAQRSAADIFAKLDKRQRASLPSVPV